MSQPNWSHTGLKQWEKTVLYKKVLLTGKQIQPQDEEIQVLENLQNQGSADDNNFGQGDRTDGKALADVPQPKTRIADKYVQDHPKESEWNCLMKETLNNGVPDLREGQPFVPNSESESTIVEHMSADYAKKYTHDLMTRGCTAASVPKYTDMQPIIDGPDICIQLWYSKQPLPVSPAHTATSESVVAFEVPTVSPAPVATSLPVVASEAHTVSPAPVATSLPVAASEAPTVSPAPVATSLPVVASETPTVSPAPVATSRPVVASETPTVSPAPVATSQPVVASEAPTVSPAPLDNSRSESLGFLKFWKHLLLFQLLVLVLMFLQVVLMFGLYVSLCNVADHHPIALTPSEISTSHFPAIRDSPHAPACQNGDKIRSGYDTKAIEPDSSNDSLSEFAAKSNNDVAQPTCSASEGPAVNVCLTSEAPTTDTYKMVCPALQFMDTRENHKSLKFQTLDFKNLIEQNHTISFLTCCNHMTHEPANFTSAYICTKEGYDMAEIQKTSQNPTDVGMLWPASHKKQSGGKAGRRKRQTLEENNGSGTFYALALALCLPRYKSSDKSSSDSCTSSDSSSDEPDSCTPVREDEPSSARPKSPHTPCTHPQPPTNAKDSSHVDLSEGHFQEGQSDDIQHGVDCPPNHTSDPTVSPTESDSCSYDDFIDISSEEQSKRSKEHARLEANNCTNEPVDGGDGHGNSQGGGSSGGSDGGSTGCGGAIGSDAGSGGGGGGGSQSGGGGGSMRGGGGGGDDRKPNPPYGDGHKIKTDDKLKSKPKKKEVKEESRQETNPTKDSGIGSMSPPPVPEKQNGRRPPTSTVSQVPPTGTNDSISQFVTVSSTCPIKPNTLTHSSKEGSAPSQGGFSLTSQAVLVHQNETAHAMHNHGTFVGPSLSVSQPSSEDSGNCKPPRQEINGGPSVLLLPRDTTTKSSIQESQEETLPPRIPVDDSVTELMSNLTTDIKTFLDVNPKISDGISPNFFYPSPVQQGEVREASAAKVMDQSPNLNVPHSIAYPTYKLPPHSFDIPNHAQPVMPPCQNFFPITCEPIQETSPEVESTGSAETDTSEQDESTGSAETDTSKQGESMESDVGMDTDGQDDRESDSDKV